jgi:hypothetical protein
MSNLKSLAAVAAPVVIALVAWGCDGRRDAVERTIGVPLAHFEQFECVPFKMTGGGRIDYPPGGPEKNPPASHQYETFGAHVIASGQVGPDGRCAAEKGSLEWVDHRPEWRINGRPLNIHSTSITYAQFATDTDCSDGAAQWGGTAVIKNTGEQVEFDVWDCDNGEPGAGHDGFGIRVYNATFEYEVLCTDPELPPAEPACTLTGGNRQFHPTH